MALTGRDSYKNINLFNIRLLKSELIKMPGLNAETEIDEKWT